jgi:hypothetical protein
VPDATRLTRDGARPALEVRPHHEDDSSRAERQEQHQAEVKFCPLPSLLSSIHLRETSSALVNIELADHGTVG